MSNLDNFIKIVRDITNGEEYKIGDVMEYFMLNSKVKKLEIADDYYLFRYSFGLFEEKFRVLEKLFVRFDENIDDFTYNHVCFCEIWNESKYKWVYLDM